MPKPTWEPVSEHNMKCQTFDSPMAEKTGVQAALLF
jgi:hypothetical protein